MGSSLGAGCHTDALHNGCLGSFVFGLLQHKKMREGLRLPPGRWVWQSPSALAGCKGSHRQAGQGEASLVHTNFTNTRRGTAQTSRRHCPSVIHKSTLCLLEVTVRTRVDMLMGADPHPHEFCPCVTTANNPVPGKLSEELFRNLQYTIMLCSKCVPV